MTALGPVGHLYLDDLTAAERQAVARDLARRQGVPVVLARDGADRLIAHTDVGESRLPEDIERLFGADHPFLSSLFDDLDRLVRHHDAGDLVLLGWRAGAAPITFAAENGSHASANPEETRAFALLPRDAPLADLNGEPLRPAALRSAALHHLDRVRHTPRRRKRRAGREVDVLRVMTYNVHSCLGMDGRLDAARIARVIARSHPDVVALQELDVGRERTAGVDQAQRIARLLEMEFHFHPAIHMEEERYGDAILTHLPQRLVKADLLPGLADKPMLEPRGALWVTVELNGRSVQVFNTHLGLRGREREAQVEALLGPDWLGHPACTGPVILCGDFNALPRSGVCRALGRRLEDAQVAAEHHRPRHTFPGRLPAVRIDHIYVGGGVSVSRIDIPSTALSRVASDHLPLVADLVLP